MRIIFIFTILILKTSADLIGQNRLGNNVRFHVVNRFLPRNGRRMTMFQIGNFLHKNRQNFRQEISQLMPESRNHTKKQKMRIRNYKKHF